MGTAYYLVRDDNRTFFDLGKGYGWPLALCGEFSSTPVVDETLESRLRLAFADHIALDYLAETARRIASWAGHASLRLLNDDMDELYDLRRAGYRVGGSRFGDDEAADVAMSNKSIDAYWPAEP